MKFLTLLALAACGGATAAPRATVTGKVGGVAVTASNAAAVQFSVGGKPAVDVFITNAADGCAANDAHLASRQTLSLGVAALSGGLDGGNYAVYDQSSGSAPQGDVAFVDWHTSDLSCANTTPPAAVGASGRVTLSRIALGGADAGVSGDFDLLLENGDRLKGTFDAPLCPSAVASDAGCH